MSYDEALAARCRKFLASEPGLGEKKMFGGLSFLLDGKMACGILGEKLVVRIDGGDAFDRALRQPFVTPMDFTGRPMRGFLYVAPEGYAGAAALRPWLKAAIAYAPT